MSTKQPDQPPSPPSPGWARRLFRFLLRFIRLLLLLLILGGIVLVWVLHEVGFPEFVKERFVAELKAKGWDLEFSRLRLQNWNSILVEDVQLRPVVHSSASPQLFVQELHGKFSYAPRKKFPLDVSAVNITGGRLLHAISPTNAPSRMLMLNDLEGELQFESSNRWELRYLQGSLRGVRVNLSGTLTNASELANLSARSGRKPSGGPAFNWEQFLHVIRDIQLTGRPELAARFQLDAKELKNWSASLNFTVPGAQSPWATVSNLVLAADLLPPADSNHLARAKVRLTADTAVTEWIQAKKTELTLEAQPSPNWHITSNAHISVHLKEAKTLWGSARQLQGSAVLHPNAQVSNVLETELSLLLREAKTPWAEAAQADLKTTISLPPPSEWKLFQTNLTWPNRLQNLPFHIGLQARQARTKQFQAGEISLQSGWAWPNLQLESASSLYGGTLLFKAGLNVTNRNLAFSSGSDIDLRTFVPLLSSNLQTWVADYSGSTAPKFQVRGQMVLPAEAKFSPKWADEALPTLALAGDFEIGPGAYRTASFLSLASSFALTNFLCQFPNLKLTRPEGSLEAHFRSQLQSGEFAWNFTSQIDPKIAKPFFCRPEEQNIFDEIEFTTPPLVEAELRGSWREPERLLFNSRAAISNFTARGEAVKSFRSQIRFTNQVLSFLEPVVERAEGIGRAERAEIDFRQQLLTLVKAESQLEPMAVARAIGPQVVRAIQPYQFDAPPHALVEGIIDLKRKSNRDDLHFQLRGGPFHWRKLRLQKVAGTINWVGDLLAITNVQAELRTGQLNGELRFDFRPKVGTDYSFKATLVEADLAELLADWASHANRIEGRLNGELTITSANTESPLSCQGFGWLSLRDGLLWDLPMFGIFSPMLNTFLPGLGNSRARKATATFLVNNSVFSTSDLEIHATAMRMQLQGSVDFEGQLDGRVEAELLRDLPAFGFLVSKVLWPVTKLFEYKLNGSLNHPKTQPLYLLPKIILTPFHPIKALKELIKEPSQSPEQPSLPGAK